MNTNTMKEILWKAENDPQFFHDLVFNPEKALEGFEIDRRLKGKIISTSPEDVIDTIIGNKDVDCGTSCGATGCTNASNWVLLNPLDYVIIPLEVSKFRTRKDLS